MADRYTGPVVYACFDHYEKKPWFMGGGMRQVHFAGWHYSTRINRHGVEMLDKKLHLNDDNPDDMFYEVATGDHKSWLEKHGVGRIVNLEG